MHPYVMEEMVRERQAELRRGHDIDRRARARTVPPWRERAGRALATLAVAVAVPRTQRRTIRCRVGAALAVEPPR